MCDFAFTPDFHIEHTYFNEIRLKSSSRAAFRSFEITGNIPMHKNVIPWLVPPPPLVLLSVKNGIFKERELKKM